MVTAYIMPIVPIGYIFMAIAAFHIISGKGFKYLYMPVAIILAFLMLNLPDITNKHNPQNKDANNWQDWSTKSSNDKVYRQLKKELPPDVKIVMNAKDYTDIMFYNKDIDAYYAYLSPDEFDKIKKQHLRVGIFNTPINPMPDYIAGYDRLYIIMPQIK